MVRNGRSLTARAALAWVSTAALAGALAGCGDVAAAHSGAAEEATC